MRRTLLLLLLLLSALVLAGCRHGDSYYQTQVANPCDGTPPSQGFACIDASLIPTPDPVHSKADKWVHCFLKSGHELEIGSIVFDRVGHAGDHAWGHVKRDAAPGRYKYTIYDRTSGTKNDPEVMIDP